MPGKPSNIVLKVFAGISFAGTIVMGILVYLAYKTLQAPTDAAEAANRYNALSNPVFHINLYLFLFNIAVSVWMKARYNRSLYFIVGLFIFVFFANIHLFWLDEQYIHFKQQFNMMHGEFSLSGILALGLAFMAAVITGIGFFIGSWLHRRTSKKTTDA